MWKLIISLALVVPHYSIGAQNHTQDSTRYVKPKTIGFGVLGCVVGIVALKTIPKVKKLDIERNKPKIVYAATISISELIGLYVASVQERDKGTPLGLIPGAAVGGLISYLCLVGLDSPNHSSLTEDKKDNYGKGALLIAVPLAPLVCEAIAFEYFSKKCNKNKRVHFDAGISMSSAKGVFIGASW